MLNETTWMIYRLKYQAPMTDADTERRTPRAINQLHTHTSNTAPMIHPAYARICHTIIPPDSSFGKYPMRKRRKSKDRKGIDKSMLANKSAGESRRRGG